MIRYLKLSLILFFTFVEVKVHAGILEQPKNCLKGLLLCSVSADQDAQAIPIQDGEVRFLKGAQLSRINAKRIKLIKGDFLVRAGEKPVTVETLYSTVIVTSGLAMFQAQAERVVLSSLTGEVRFSPKGSKEQILVPKGLQNEVGPVRKSGVAQSEYPRSMALHGLVEKWTQFFIHKEFQIVKDDFEKFIPSWRDSLNFVGPWYLETINRQLAEQEEAEARRMRLKEERLKEENYYREMFRRRNLVE